MTAAAFLSTASRFRCRPFMAGRELAPGAVVARQGEACLHCQVECSAGAKAASLTLGCIEAFPKGEAVELRWACPGCGASVTEECRPLDALRVSADIERDPLCHRCRKAAAA